MSLALAAGGDKLIGSWKSDKEKTLAAMQRITMRLKPEQYAQLESLLGKMSITYDGKRASWTIGDESDSRDYVVASEVEPMLLIESTSPKTKLKESIMLRFTGTDEYWVSDPRFPGFEECFIRQASSPKTK